MEEDQQGWEERNGRIYCKKCGVELVQRLIPAGDWHGGWMKEPPLECPECHQSR